MQDFCDLSGGSGRPPAKRRIARARPPRAIISWMLLAALLAASPALAADPQPYKFGIEKTGNGDLDTALKQSTYLETLRKKAPVEPFAMVARANEDVSRLQTTLQSFGYYQAHARITIEKRDLSDPGLLTWLDSLPAGQDVQVYAHIDHGPLYRLRRITIDGAVPKDPFAKLDLKQDQPAVAADVIAAGTRLLTALQEDGYALAKVDPPVAYADDSAHVIDLTFKVDEGRRANIGAIAVTGVHQVNEDVGHTAILVKSGYLYRPSKIEEARKSLLSLGVFSGVEGRGGDRVDEQGRVPLTFDVSER